MEAVVCVTLDADNSSTRGSTNGYCLALQIAVVLGQIQRAVGLQYAVSVVELEGARICRRRPKPDQGRLKSGVVSGMLDQIIAELHRSNGAVSGILNAVRRIGGRRPGVVGCCAHVLDSGNSAGRIILSLDLPIGGIGLLGHKPGKVV